MTKEKIRPLFSHMLWADALVQDALAAAVNPPQRAVNLYAHVLGAELVWLDRIEQVEQSVPVWPDADLSACAQLALAAKERYETLLESLATDKLMQPIPYTNSAGQSFETPLDDILIHVALHGAYHRGQIALLLRDANHEPNPTDYIGFVRGVPAARST